MTNKVKKRRLESFLPLKTSEHAIKLRFLFLIKLAPNPGQGGEHGVGKPVPTNLDFTDLQFFTWVSFVKSFT